MRRFLTLAAGSILAIAFSQIAFAADLPVKAPPAVAPTPAAHNWTGFYLGGNVGWARQRVDGTSDFTQPFPTTSTPLSESPSDDSFIGGLQLGYNWQFAPHWVVGIEGDWQWTDPHYSFCRKTDSFPAGSTCADAPPNNRGIVTVTSSTRWLTTLRGRLGWTWDRFFIYGTGGGAWGKVDTTLTASCSVGGCGNNGNVNVTSTDFSNTQGGWVAGAGVEAVVYGNWTAKLEWLHIDLGNVTDAFSTSPSVGSYGVSWSRNMQFDTVRLGVNYKFF
jgi:outer membrane immunogenic protein